MIVNASITRTWRPDGGLLPELRRRRRVVIVEVLVDGYEEDRFEVGSSAVLRAALRPLEAHLPADCGMVRLIGIEQRWFPLGLGRTSCQTELPSREAALAFLAG